MVKERPNLLKFWDSAIEFCLLHLSTVKALALSVKSFLKSQPGGPIVVACSGGVDSVALAHAAAPFIQGLIHVHHGQHHCAGEAQALVESLGRALGVPVRVARLSVTEAPAGASEAVLRRARLRAFAALTAEDATAVMLAHHSQDQLETYLLKLLRGAHPSTIKGMAPASRVGGLRLLRPWLKASKAEILAYAAAHGLPWVEDPTNDDGRFARNDLRLRLLPLLEEIRPRSTGKILKFFEELEAMRPPAPPPRREIREALKNGLALRSDAVDFESLRAALQESLGESAARTTRGQWESLRKILLSRARSGELKRVQFPGGNEIVFMGEFLKLHLGEG